MGKFNKSTKRNCKTTNLTGGDAYKISDLRTKVMTEVLTSFVSEKKYYGDNSIQMLSDIRNLIAIDAKFVANLAVYTRRVMYMRSITHVLVVELAHSINGKQYVREVVNQVATRVDDLTEIMSLYIHTFKKPIPNSMKKGIADVLVKQSEYSLAKYNRKNKDITLKDLVMLTHPNPDTQESQTDLMKKILDDSLETPITWETQLSIHTGKTKQEKWESLIENKQLGYMATLRNLRNILTCCDTKHIDMAINYIKNPNAIQNGKQLPFRYLSAYREVEGMDNASSKVLDALEDALSISTQHLEKMKGRTLLICDNSGSMSNPLSERSTVTYKDISTLMMAIAHRYCDDAVTTIFASDFKIVNTSTRNGIIGNMNTFAREHVGYSTELWRAFDWLVKSNEKFDRIIILSDMQTYNRYRGRSSQQYLDEYRKNTNPDVWVHSVDLAGYGTSEFSRNNKLNLISGWNDKVMKYITTVEQGNESIIAEIEKYHFV